MDKDKMYWRQKKQKIWIAYENTFQKETVNQTNIKENEKLDGLRAAKKVLAYYAFSKIKK